MLFHHPAKQVSMLSWSIEAGNSGSNVAGRSKTTMQTSVSIAVFHLYSFI
jgi:hypothetical protein